MTGPLGKENAGETRELLWSISLKVFNEKVKFCVEAVAQILIMAQPLSVKVFMSCNSRL